MTTKPNGNGLGLPMARALARQHGGDLRLETATSGLGCAAVLTLPIAGPTLAQAESAARESPFSGEHDTIPMPTLEPDRCPFGVVR